jgi:hypothetical protein
MKAPEFTGASLFKNGGGGRNRISGRKSKKVKVTTD